MILVCFRHALRVSELCDLEWRDVLDLDKEARASLNVRRLKGSVGGAHQLEPDEVKGLRKRRKAHPDAVYVFTSERGSKLTPAAFRKMFTRLAGRAWARRPPYSPPHASARNRVRAGERRQDQHPGPVRTDGTREHEQHEAVQRRAQATWSRRCAPRCRR